MCMASSDPGQAALANQQQQQAAIQAATGQVNSAFAGFNPAFYNNYTQANEAYGLGQLAPQLQNTQNQLGFKLAGQGLQNSGSADTLGASLQTEAGNQKQNIVNSALGATNTLEQNVNQQKSNLINEANVANDPSTVSNQALGVASSFSAPSPIAPIGQAFGNWANQWLGSVQNKTYTNTNSAPVYGGAGGNYGSYGSSLNPITQVNN